MLIVHEVEKQYAALQPLDDETGLCECGHHWSDHRDENYDADVAGSMPGQGRCGECDCSKFTNRRQGSLDGGCVWKGEDEAYGLYQIGCTKHDWSFDEDGIKENGFKFCPYCGKAIIEKLPPPFVAGESDGKEEK